MEEPRTPITRTTPLDELPELLTIAEFQKWAGISRITAYNMIHSGKISSVRFNRAIRVVRASLEQFVHSR
jgi:excisionase family DNA binding protein